MVPPAEHAGQSRRQTPRCRPWPTRENRARRAAHRRPRVATARANHNLPDNSRRFLAEQSQPEAQVQVAVKYGLHGP